MDESVERVTVHKRVIVVGLGQTGLSCVRFLNRRGYQVAVVDSRKNPPGQEELAANYPQVTLSAGSFDVDVLLSADEIVLSPGVALAEPALQKAVNNGIPVVGDIDLFCREVDAPIVAITGSNAKSTVTDLVGAMARAAQVKVKVGGNIGTPVLELLDADAEELNKTELYVLELSSFQLETTHDLKPAVATVLNVSEDHMDRYDGMQSYVAAKHRVFNGCQKLVVNRDDAMSHGLVGSLVETYSFGLSNDSANLKRQFGVIDVESVAHLAYEQIPLCKVSDLKIIGAHNVTNALAALALGLAVGLDMPAMLSALMEYKGLPHRCEMIGSWNQVEWFNDSKGTNVGATIAAIEGLNKIDCPEHKLILIAGGEGKGQDFSPLKVPVANNVRHTLLIGRDALGLKAEIKESTLCDSLIQAVEMAARFAQPGDRVVLSPACASFDMFAGYEDRGEQFVAAVKGLYSSTVADVALGGES